MSNSQTALITGINGQDGTFLAQSLLEKGYTVHGTVRSMSCSDFSNLLIFDLVEKVIIHEVQMHDFENLGLLLSSVNPDEIYHLAANSSVASSIVQPFDSFKSNTLISLVLLEAVRLFTPQARCFYALSSELFSGCKASPQSELTKFAPLTPYGMNKQFVYNYGRYYKEYFGTFVSFGILFNHESELRSDHFLTQKVVSEAINVIYGEQAFLEVGNLDAIRDWGFAGDFVEAFWRILQLPSPDDYVIATGRATSVRELIEIVFGLLGTRIRWKGIYLNEVGYLGDSDRVVVKVKKEFYRPCNEVPLVGDSAKARRELLWKPELSLENLLLRMVKFHLDKLSIGDP